MYSPLATNPAAAAAHYKVYVKSEVSRGTSKPHSANWTVPAAISDGKPKKESESSITLIAVLSSVVAPSARTLSYWCFNPGHAMCDLTQHGVRSVLLTSGTLSPLSSFSSELKL